MAQDNVRKAKAIHDKRQAKLDRKIAGMRQGTVGTQLQKTINRGYGKPKG